MGRRKKEPEQTHRQAIADAAGQLFSRSSIAAVTMDEIARAAGYSKATLYVYFQNKDEIVDFLVLESMRGLYRHIAEAVQAPSGTSARYFAVCHALAAYQAQYPLYFTLALGEIQAGADCPPVRQETFAVGEEINRTLSEFLAAGMQAGDLRADLPVLQTVFLFWATLSGLILLAANKHAYLEAALGQSSAAFLEDGFERLYGLIAKEAHT